MKLLDDEGPGPTLGMFIIGFIVIFAIVGLLSWLGGVKADCGRMPCWQVTCEYNLDCGVGCFCHHDNGRLEPGVCLHRD